ncbi:hypothetical protein [Tepidimonas sp.]
MQLLPAGTKADAAAKAHFSEVGPLIDAVRRGVSRREGSRSEKERVAR